MHPCVIFKFKGLDHFCKTLLLLACCWCSSNSYGILVRTLSSPLLHWPPPSMNVWFCVCVCANTLQHKAGASSKAAARPSNHSPSEKCCLAPYLLLNLAVLLLCHLSLWQLSSLLSLLNVSYRKYVFFLNLFLMSFFATMCLCPKQPGPKSLIPKFTLKIYYDYYYYYY